MALVVFLRGVNVGGHRTFRPRLLAKELSGYGVVNVGAAGTFVARQPGSPVEFCAALRRKLPFKAELAFCNGRDLLRLVERNPFGADPPAPGLVRFVSVLCEGVRAPKFAPVSLPADGEWLVRTIAAKDRFVFGMYRRHMKTIGYLGQLEKHLQARGTVRNWNTILAVARILQAEGKAGV